ncbi:MAG: hypothetical protein L0Y54_23810 [Sporichthyaceae bacterium]|nr:hypothetical protein [Sporichthyaceae bacterium]
MNRTHPDDSDDVVLLDRDDAEYLRDLLGRVEEWLRHAGYETVEDLAEFLNTPGNGRLAAAGMLASLGEGVAWLNLRLADSGRRLTR